MQKFVDFMLGRQPPHGPTPALVTGIRFPADGSMAHLVTLTTTTYDIRDGLDGCWGHVPDLREFWKTSQAWQWRDIETFRLENQSISSCNGLYVLFYSFDLESLPENSNFPEAIFGRQRSFAGDAFIVRLKSNNDGHEVKDDDGWAVWENVPSDILSLPILAM